MEACCTCATRLCDVARYSPSSEKPLPSDRILECCTRVICGNCIHQNPRFSSYCPYCQMSSKPSTLPQGLKEPPPYASDTTAADPPPPYRARSSPPRQRPPSPPSATDEKAALAAAEKAGPPAQDTLHFLDHRHDSIASLSLRYGVPAPALRQANQLSADHLLAARRTVLIPGAYYGGGVSLSPRPVEGEEEEERKSRIRRWQVATKVADYDVAVLYLEHAGYDLAEAVERYFADEAWEREHPLEVDRGKGKGKGPAGAGWPWNRVSQAAFLRRAGPSNPDK